jgi:hypothetical protein
MQVWTRITLGSPCGQSQSAGKSLFPFLVTSRRILRGAEDYQRPLASIGEIEERDDQGTVSGLLLNLSAEEES